MPVSVIATENSNVQVISRYSDSIWDFYPYIPQENLKRCHKRLDWNIRLNNGKRLTDPGYARLLDSSKDFIWSLFYSPADGYQRLGMSTLIAKAGLLQPLLSWMVDHGMDQFHQLDGHTLEYAAVARYKGTTSELVSKSTVHYRLHILEFLYRQREKLADSLTEHPWPLETALSLSGNRRGGTNRKPSTEVIPDHIAKNLIALAYDYIYKRSPLILSALTALTNIPRDSLTKRDQVWSDARTATARSLGFSGASALRTETVRLRTACYVVIDLFSGLRDSELLSLEAGCISRGHTTDAGTEAYWLHGTIYKLGRRPKKWLVPQPVVDAIGVLEKLSAPLRDKLREELHELESLLATPGVSEQPTYLGLLRRLHTTRAQQGKLFLSVARKYGNEISVISGTRVGNDLKSFSASSAMNEADRKYRLHAHQFRRSYACFVARAELGDLITLQEHLGHWTLDMTVYYADGASDEYEVDTELVEMVGNEKLLRHEEIVSSYLLSDSPVATGATWLKQWRQTVRTAQSKEELIKKYAGTITLNGTGHSWCTGNSRGRGCGGLCVFEAQTCVDCHYGIIGQEHRPVWNGIREQQLDALALDDMGPGGKELANDILRIAEKVLKRLDGGAS
ncbi:integrase [Massilia sp. NP310]|nr:integrase [Massilia sp. NP310]